MPSCNGKDPPGRRKTQPAGSVAWVEIVTRILGHATERCTAVIKSDTFEENCARPNIRLRDSQAAKRSIAEVGIGSKPA
jgi:hypothetical protein